MNCNESIFRRKNFRLLYSYTNDSAMNSLIIVHANNNSLFCPVILYSTRSWLRAFTLHFATIFSYIRYDHHGVLLFLHCTEKWICPSLYRKSFEVTMKWSEELESLDNILVNASPLAMNGKCGEPHKANIDHWMWWHKLQNSPKKPKLNKQPAILRK